MATQHLPTPYEAKIVGNDVRIEIVNKETSRNLVCDFHRHAFHTPKERARLISTAEFIVRACNAHDDLLKACKTVVTFHAASYLPNDVYDLLLTAIDKAEGE